MLKIKHKELAKILGISIGYSRVLLGRNKMKIRQEYLYKIIDLIVQRREKKTIERIGL
jgi:hypothetical protein